MQTEDDGYVCVHIRGCVCVKCVGSADPGRYTADWIPISPQPACLPVLRAGGRKVNVKVDAASVLGQINADAAVASCHP